MPSRRILLLLALGAAPLCAADLVTSEQATISFGHQTIGMTSPVSTEWTVTLSSPENDNLTNYTVTSVGEGGLDFTDRGETTCDAGTGNGPTCTLGIGFAPKEPGLRRGSAILTYTDQSVTPYVQRTITVQLIGYGDAPVSAVSPGNLSLVNTGGASLQSPGQLALDGSGNLYVANSTADNVIKINAGGGSHTTVSTAPAVLGTVAGVVIDGSANLYIADETNSKIVKIGENLGVVEVDTVTASSVGLNGPSALAIDDQANLYIADNGNGRILELPFADFVAGNASVTATVVPTPSITFTPGSITGLAVDSTGILYVTDGTRIVTVSADHTIASVFSISGFTVLNPTGIAVDGFDNLYIGDSGNPNQILRVTNPATSPSATAMTFYGSTGPTSLNGVAIDATGDLYLSGAANDQMFQIFKLDASAGGMVFPSVYEDSSSPSQTALIANIGNQPLVMTSESSASANFPVTAVSPCVVQVSGSPSLSITSGNSCEYSVTFSPMSGGLLSANLTFTDSDLNHPGTTQVVSLSGLAISSQSITFNPLGNQAYGTAPFTISATATSGLPVSFASITSTICTVSGNTVTLLATGTCTIQATQPGNVSYEPATPVSQSFTVSSSGNTITFNALSNQLAGTAPFTISATATSGLAVSFASTTPSVCTVSGSTVTLLATGTCTIQATQAGNATYQAATPVSQSFAISAAPYSSLTLSSNPNPSMVNQAVTFTATINSNVGSSPTGEVQFFDGTTLLGNSSVSGSAATFSTSGLAIGQHNIVAKYSGGDGVPSSQGNLFQVVKGSSVSMTLQVSPATLVYGQPFSLSASVAPSGSGAPTGQVSFYSAANPFSQSLLNTVPLTAGAASINITTPIPAGSGYFQAQYSGDSNFAAGFSQARVTIQPSNTNTSVSFSVDGSMLQATVSPAAPGSGTPTGTVQFIDFSTNSTIATATLSNGSASAAANSSMLTTSIYALYSGDPNFQASTSPFFSNDASAAFSGTVAPDEIVSLNNLSGLSSNLAATSLPLSNNLGGIGVSITDSTGTSNAALLYGVFASTGQINLVIPSGTATGKATISVQFPSGASVSAPVQVAPTAPGFFTTTQTVTDPSSGNMYLIVYGTGFRHAATVTATINGTAARVAYSGPQSVSPGLDQLNLELPPGVQVPFTVTVTVDGSANTLTIPQ